jgi:hypothetical protein
MPVLQEEIAQYREFAEEILKDLGCLDIDPNAVLWHYTTGPALLGIIESGTIYATQVACLNDSTEVRYSSRLLQKELTALKSKYCDDNQVDDFIGTALEFFKEEPEFPAHAGLMYFVTCFSQQRDDLTQWRSYGGGENGYAIGFKASSLFGVANTILAKVNYDISAHDALAKKVAEATVRFFREGQARRTNENPSHWGGEFLAAWDYWITQLAPMVKDPGFSSENEFRLVHQFQYHEFARLRFVQKATLMSRHLPLVLLSNNETRLPKLPLSQIIVGPCRHREITRISVDAALRQMGYGSGLVLSSERPFQSV